jgi:hypothetical protein
MTATEWLQEWYRQACNGTWEHAHGIRIDTLDNPGWRVQIDLAGTTYARRSSYQLALENSPTDWLRCSKEGQHFVGYGDPGKLEAIFLAFKEWAEEKCGPLG